MQTSNKIVYAIGDVMGGPNFTHVAVDQAVAAVQNALLGRKKAKRDLAELPWATFTYPEIAHLGADEASLIKSKIKFETHVLNLAAVDKAVADQESGQVKVMVDDKGLILGATVIGGPASEIIGQLALAKHEKLKLVDLGGTLQAYPTYAFGLKLFANGLSLKKFEAGPQKKFATLLRKFTLR
jgi:pyruvate/2-oxoglutarate dehydrogenase complex dihydrolipoamide dehydrogenase (E3) component